MANEPRRATSNMEDIPDFIAKNMDNAPYSESANITTNTTTINQKIGFRGNFLRGTVSNRSSGLSFVKLIFLLYFVLSIYVFLVNDKQLNFQGFLEGLGAWNENINISGFFNNLSSYLYIADEWPILDGFRVFLNLCGRLIGFVLGCIGGLLDIISFITVIIFGVVN